MQNKNMPELPEVETVRKIIDPLLTNKTIKNIYIYYDRLIQSDIEDFKNKLINQKFISVDRYGKYLFLNLTNDLVIITHLRMEGKFRFSDNFSNSRIKHTSLTFLFDDGTCMNFDDTRKFGLMFLTTKSLLKEVPMIKKLGIEANKVQLSDFETLEKKLKKNKKIKELLLDQTILCGIGNIYADEILFASKIHPLTKGKDLKTIDIINIINNSIKILEKAINLGGSTIHSFHPSEGVDGRFQEVLQCYGNEGKKCPNCGTTFRKIFVGGRGTTYCPNCQIDASLKKAIGITGPIGSGKSTVLKYFKDNGFETISCDEEIHKLYEDEKIKSKLSKILETDFDYFDAKKREIIKKILVENPDKKLKLQDYVYPILAKKLENFVINSQKPVIEAPLLFNAHLEYLFSKIILLEINEDNQKKNLITRNSNVDFSKKINKTFFINEQFDGLIKIKNNSSKEELYRELDKIIN